MKHQLMVKKDFFARHHLPGPEWGDEQYTHTHQYIFELVIEGNSLDEHGFLIDIDLLHRDLEEIIAVFRDTEINELPDFHGGSPSLERFAQSLATRISGKLRGENITGFTVRLWESPDAWASCSVTRDELPE